MARVSETYKLGAGGLVEPLNVLVLLSCYISKPKRYPFCDCPVQVFLFYLHKECHDIGSRGMGSSVFPSVLFDFQV